MAAFIMFLVKSILISGILFSYYLLFLKNRKFSHFNRFFLNAILFLSLVLPFIHLPFFNWQLPGTISGTDFLASVTGDTAISEMFLLPLLYILISGFLLLSISFKVYVVFRIRRKSKRVSVNGFSFIETDDDRAPFSFFNNLFWQKGADPKTVEGRQIMEHESIHIRQHHSYDKLICQVVCSLFWVNPFFWCIQKELSVVHEFLADEVSFGPEDTFRFAKMLLSSYSYGSYLDPELGFNKSDIARRISMIELRKKKQSALGLTGMTVTLLFAVCIILFANSYTHFKPPSTDQSKASEQFEKKLQDEENSLKRSP